MSRHDIDNISERLGELDWDTLTETLDHSGFVQTPAVYSASECELLESLFDQSERFRSTVDMGRHRFGEGQYRYFGKPLPEIVDQTRHGLYPPLANLANSWAQRLDRTHTFPEALPDFLDRCHQADQTRPTPLLLRYGAGGYNALHQDLYGEVAFPLQAVCLLNRPGLDFDGGQFVLVEQRPRAQSRAHVVDLQRGAFVIFATRVRPVRGTRGYYRTTMRHGVATVRSGRRTTLGIIFHDSV